MVFEGTIASLLTSLISRYANAKGSDVGLGIRGGYLSLENVDLNIDVLNDANLPFSITSVCGSFVIPLVYSNTQWK
jgi:hypothetical protein